MKNLKEIITENSNDVIFDIFGQKLTVSSQRCVHKNILSKYEELAYDAEIKFEEYLDEMKNLDEFFASVYDAFIMSIEESIDEVAKDAISVGCFNMDSETILSECIKNEYFNSFADVINEYQAKDDAIISSLSNAAQYREYRKNTRSRWTSVTYGGNMFDAWSNKMKTSTMNAVEGLGHTIINEIGNAWDESKANDLRRDLFKNANLRQKLENSVWKCAYNLRLVITNAINSRCGLSLGGWVTASDRNEAESIFNNLVKYDMPDEQKKSLIIHILELDPYNYSYYKQFLKMYFENAAEIIKIASFFDLDELSVEISSILEEYVKSNIGTTPDDLNKCRNYINENAQKLNLDDKDLEGALEIISNQGKNLLLNYVSENIGSSEQDAYDCKTKINELKDYMCLSDTEAHEAVKIIDDKLIQIDIDLRTVKGVLFETREKAQNARNEIDQNKETLENVEYVGKYDYLKHMEQVKKLNINKKLINKYVLEIGAKLLEFEKKCKRASRHQYRLNHRNSILWNGNTSGMLIKYLITFILIIVTFGFAFKSNFPGALLWVGITALAVYLMFIYRSNNAMEIWCELTHNGKYSFDDIINADKPCSETNNENNIPKPSHTSKKPFVLLAVYLVLVLFVSFGSSGSKSPGLEPYESIISELEDGFNKGDTNKILDTMLTRDMKNEILDYQMEGINNQVERLNEVAAQSSYKGKKWKIIIKNATKYKDTSEVREYYLNHLRYDIEIKEAYNIEGILRFCDNNFKCNFDVIKLNNNKWIVSENFFNSIS